jgi:hypothetical protein
MIPNQSPSRVRLALYVRFCSLPSGVEGIEILLEPWSVETLVWIAQRRPGLAQNSGHYPSNSTLASTKGLGLLETRAP